MDDIATMSISRNDRNKNNNNNLGLFIKLCCELVHANFYEKNRAKWCHDRDGNLAL